jgi:hypothetical protein
VKRPKSRIGPATQSGWLETSTGRKKTKSRGEILQRWREDEVAAAPCLLESVAAERRSFILFQTRARYTTTSVFSRISHLYTRRELVDVTRKSNALGSHKGMKPRNSLPVRARVSRHVPLAHVERAYRTLIITFDLAQGCPGCAIPVRSQLSLTPVKTLVNQTNLFIRIFVRNEGLD